MNIWWGWTWLQRGELDDAEAALCEASEQLQEGFGDNGPPSPTALDFSPGRSSKGAIRLALGRLWLAAAPPTRHPTAMASCAEALGAADEYHARLRGIDNPAWAPWRSLKALALDGLGRHAEALALLEEELEQTRRWGAPGALARTLRLADRFRGDEGHELLREAVAVAEGSPARLEHAKALIALGSAPRRAGRRSEAGEPLGRGFELANRCGALPLAEGAKTELYAAGGRPRREAQSRPEALTPKRAADCRAGRERAHQSRHRAGAVHHYENGRGSPHQHLSQARHLHPQRAGRRPRRPSVGIAPGPRRKFRGYVSLGRKK